MRRMTIGGLLLCALTALPAARAESPDAAKVSAAVDKAAAFLKTKQGKDGSFAPKLGGPGVTALTVAGLIRNGKTVDDPVVAAGLKYLEGSVKDDGGVYAKGLQNYTTCVAVLAFKDANKDGRYDKVIANAAKYLRTLQNADDEADPKFGGVGYDGKSRPDLSNTQYFIDALVAAGVGKDDPAMKRATAFVSRCQNEPSEAQSLPFAKAAAEADKGGFVYNPSEAGSAKSPNATPGGGLRSVGSMGYAGLKSFLYAGVGKDDPRVKAAVAWLRKNYTVSSHPGQGDAGYFYYLHTFAKAMSALGEDPFLDDKGGKHAWKVELADELLKRQAEDGSWVNKSQAFGEASPELATAFALLSLSYAGK